MPLKQSINGVSIYSIRLTSRAEKLTWSAIHTCTLAVSAHALHLTRGVTTTGLLIERAAQHQTWVCALRLQVTSDVRVRSAADGRGLALMPLKRIVGDVASALVPVHP
mmetsp:Transcript_42259/g.95483  ORF Transcript_42259/g.95483 Transcript_42259/m.95483 type:complete len:108 (-) Transcript_42259:56-379(-)